MGNEIMKHEPSNFEVQISQQFQEMELQIKYMDFDLKLSEKLAKTQFVPKQYQGHPEDCFAAIQYGRTFGLQPLQSLQNIHVINGRPGLSSQAMFAVCMKYADGPPEILMEEKAGQPFAASVAWTRKGNKKTVRFTMDDAKKAKLTEKTGSLWNVYPANMLQWRAAAFCSRLMFPDVLAGVYTHEELQEITNEIQPPKIINPIQEPSQGAPDIPQSSLLKDFIQKHQEIFKTSVAEGQLKSFWSAMQRELKASKFSKEETEKVIVDLTFLKEDVKKRLLVEESERKILQSIYDGFVDQLKSSKNLNETWEIVQEKASEELFGSWLEDLQKAYEAIMELRGRTPDPLPGPGEPAFAGSNYTGD